MKLFIGLMSGTSMDGIDAALVDLSSNTFIAGVTRPYSKETKQLLNEVCNTQLVNLSTYSQLNTLLGREFSQAALDVMKKARILTSAICAIGSHGQTLCHDATAAIPYTVQLGCAHTIAQQTGITVVADFRTRDLVVGGQGAPFAPIYHQALFKKQAYPLAIVNIGGIANLTYLSETEVSGYDLGPGNCLMDHWIQKHQGSAYDHNGVWGASGRVIKPLLESLLTDPYFQRTPPKSIGKEYFSLTWLSNYLQADWAKEDVQATLLMLTARPIVHALTEKKWMPKQLFVCGGGAHNLALMNLLACLLPNINVASTNVIKINPDFVEAIMFAWLAEKTLSNVSMDLSQITGSKQPIVLGSIFPGTNYGNVSSLFNCETK